MFFADRRHRAGEYGSPFVSRCDDCDPPHPWRVPFCRLNFARKAPSGDEDDPGFENAVRVLEGD